MIGQHDCSIYKCLIIANFPITTLLNNQRKIIVNPSIKYIFAILMFKTVANIFHLALTFPSPNPVYFSCKLLPSFS